MDIERRHDAASVKQTRVFSFLNERDRDAVSLAWEMSLAFVVHSALDLTILERAFRNVMQKQVEARSAFRATGSALRVETLASSQFALSGVTSRRVSREEALSLARAQASCPFASFNQPLVALYVYPHTDGTTLIALQLCHLIADGVSAEMLVNDLILAYLADGVAPPSSGASSFADYVDWEEAFLESEAGEAQRIFWRQRQPPAPGLADLPYIAPPNGDAIKKGAVRRFEADDREADAVDGRAKKLGATPFAVLLTCFMRAIADWSGNDFLPMSFAMARRHRKEFAGTLGDLAYASPTNCAVARDESFDAAVRSVAAEVQAMSNNQDFPVAALDANWRSIARAPAQGLPGFPQITFGPLSGLRHDRFSLSGLLHAPAGTKLKLGAMEVESVSLGTVTCPRDLHVSYIMRPHGVTFAVNYNADRLGEAAIDALANGMIAQLRS